MLVKVESWDRDLVEHLKFGLHELHDVPVDLFLETLRRLHPLRSHLDVFINHSIQAIAAILDIKQVDRVCTLLVAEARLTAHHETGALKESLDISH